MKKLTFENKGEPLAIIRGGRKNNEIVYFVEDDDKSSLKIENLLDHVSEKKIRSKKKYMSLKDIMKVKRAFETDQIDEDIEEIYESLKEEVGQSIKKHIHIQDGSFEPIPLMKPNQVDHCFYSGMTGIGKSTQIAIYCKQYKKLFPSHQIYLFSRKDDDHAFKDIDLKKIRLDDDILNIKFNIDDVSDSLCIFDDIDTLPLKIEKVVRKIRDDLLECGRDKNIYMCNVSHQVLNYTKTRSLVLESNKIIIFPRSSQYQIRRFLKEYMGIENDSIKQIMSANSRWVMINKTYPLTVISEHDIYIL